MNLAYSIGAAFVVACVSVFAVKYAWEARRGYIRFGPLLTTVLIGGWWLVLAIWFSIWPRTL